MNTDVDVVVYGTDNCPKCGVVRGLLEKNGVEYQYKTVHEDITKEELEFIVSRDVRSVPVVTLNGEERTLMQFMFLFGANGS